MNLVFLIGIVITLATGIPVFNQLRKTHPKGLMILFFAEMWERFSYYGMRGLLVFYLTQHLLFDQKAASSQYGSYTSLVYLLPLLGGMIADRWLGMRKAVAFGGSCPQGRDIGDYAKASDTEDCLYLNVYVPAKASPKRCSRGS